MNKKLVMMSAASVLALSACSSTQDTAGPDASKAQKVTYEYKRDRVQEQINTIPDWFKMMPTDSDNIFSAGTSVTPDMQFSIDAAVLNAKVILADRINSRLRSQVKQFRAKVGDGDLDATVMTELEKAVKNITANTDVSGYRAYVLLEYSDAEARKILSNRVRKDQMLMDKIRATRAWRELDETAEQQKMDDAARVDAIINSEY
jgi:protein involved in sex pheromone biosynthesis